MKEYSAYEMNRKLQYMMEMRPVLKKRGLFSDGTADYRIPAEPQAGDTVIIRFRAAINNVDVVWLWNGDKRYTMRKTETEDEFDYFSVQIPLGKEKFYYYFEVCTGLLHCYYDRYGVTTEHRSQYEFCIQPGFHTPDWAKGAVMYQILVDRFYNGDPTNDVEDDEYFYIRHGSRKMQDWNQVPSSFSVAEFYGGDLEGVRQKLDYLKDLGVEVIYFNPLFVSPSNHKYDSQDYDYIDPHYGKIVSDGGDCLMHGDRDNRKATKYQKRVTDIANLEASNRLFIRLVEEAHARGIRVILDGVFNHCGSFHKWMDREEIYRQNPVYDKGAYIDRDSSYRDFFRFQDQNAWPYNTTYEGWWGHDTLPKLNYDDSKELYQYILEIGKKWVSAPYNADGWRLDVAADLGHSEEFNHQFWKDFRQAVKSANSDAIILAEHYGDATSWLQGDQWDTIMNYSAFMEPVTWFLTGMEKHSDSFDPSQIGNASNFEGAMNHFMTNFLTPSLQCSMNQLSNHDHSRFLTRTNHRVGRAEQLGPETAELGTSKPVLREAVVMLMTWPGAPTLYYGDEAGQYGFTDPDNRRTYPWDNPDQELIQFHKEMIAIHKEHQALRTGSLKMLGSDYQYLAYGRFTRDEQFVILVNNDDRARRVKQSVWAAGLPQNCEMNRLMITSDEGFSSVPIRYPVKEGKLEVLLPAHCAAVFKRV
ncbi:MAG: glycoside hydrolase family 13 protein [bacterium]|nr:glycoside hydrolase family 13 protein [bacterium]MDY4101232.1 glycoside hydrolase family 13 protein [Lachnospiraceae bacterium]